MQRYQQAIINDKVPLSIFDLVLFYTSSLFALVVGLIFFYRINFTDFKFDTTNQTIILNIFSIVFIAFGIYTAILNRQHFKFKFIESSKSKEEKEKIILGIANKSNWTLIKKTQIILSSQTLLVGQNGDITLQLSMTTTAFM